MEGVTALSRTLSFALAGAISAACLVVAAAASGASGPLVRTAHNARLNTTVLVDRHGHTLYDLSVERKGRFICTTSTCLSFWHPLVVAKGTKPTGQVALSTIKRPDGRIQVTFKGAPLYTFVQDVTAGDVKGDGFKDVGVWHAASTGAKTTAAPTAPAAPTDTTSGGGGYGYGPGGGGYR
jgi:predicted lipoprotein with Yx(FWY)xxD motif